MIPILKAAACDFKLFGKIEKIFATYGFVVTADGQRYFFHFGTCITKPEFFRVGDDVEFVLGEDTKTHRLHAQKLYKCSSPPPVNSAMLNRAALFSYIPISLDGASSASLPISHQSSPPSSSPTSFVTCMSSQLLTKSNLADRENMTKSLLQLQQHSSASVRCVGLVLSLPSSNSNTRGYIACEIAGNPTFVYYQLASLKNLQERSLIQYGTKVHLTAVWHAQTGTWTAKEIVPEVQMQKGVVCYVSTNSIVIDCLTCDKRVEYSIRGKNEKMFEIGMLVEFVFVTNDKGAEAITRLTILSSTSNSVMDDIAFDPIEEESTTVDVTLSENVGVCEIGTMDYDSPHRIGYCAEELSQAFSPVSTTSISSLDLVKKSDSQQIEALQLGKQNNWDEYGLFTQTRALIPIGNLPTTPNNAYDKAREAWFSVSG